MKYCILLSFLLLPYFGTAQIIKIDSLEGQLSKPLPDTTKVNIINALVFEYIFIQKDSASQYLTQALRLAKQIGYAKGEAESYNMQGLLLRVNGRYVKALESHFAALTICERINDQMGKAFNLGNIGMIYSEQQDYPKAVEYYEKALRIKEKMNDQMGMAFTLNDLAMAHLQLKHYEQSLAYNLRALAINEKQQNQGGIAYNYLNIGNVYSQMEDWVQAERELLKAEDLCRKYQNAFVEVQVTQLLAQTYHALAQLPKAKSYGLRSLALAQKQQMKKDIKNAALVLSKIYFGLQDYQRAYEYQHLFIAYKDSLNSLDIEKKTALIAAQYDYDKKEALLRAEHEQESNQQKWVVFSVFAALLSVIIIAGLMFRSRNQIRKAYQNLKVANQEVLRKTEEISVQNEEINQQKEELLQTLLLVEKQRVEINKKNQDFRDSITSALRIQQAILPRLEDIREIFPDFFVLYEPKDIVSGDLYWFAHKINKQIIAVIDCTGHGVSGAFMTMIANNMLNHIIHDHEIHTPHEILNLMPIFLAKTLQHSQNKMKEGMDISILTIHQPFLNPEGQKIRTIEFSGAMQSLYYVQNQAFHEIKALKKSIDSLADDQQEVEYPLFSTTITEATMFYLFSDGYADQFGGTEKRKFMKKRFKELLLSIANEPLDRQQALLLDNIRIWQATGNEKQTDDITVLGIRL